MRDFNFTLSRDTSNDFHSYDIDQPSVKRFIKMCQENEVNPFPILHQAYRGIFLLKDQNYASGISTKILDSLATVLKALPDKFPAI